MLDNDPGMLPRRPASKIAYIVVSFAVVIGLCAVACSLAGGIAESIACSIVNIDTQERCP